MVGVFSGVILTVSWVALGFYAIVPTLVVALIATQNIAPSREETQVDQRLLIVLLGPLALGLVLSFLFGNTLLPGAKQAISYMAETRPLQTKLAHQALGGSLKGQWAYLMLLVGEAVMVAIVLYFASAPVRLRGFVQSATRDMATSAPSPSAFRGLFLMLVGAGLFLVLHNFSSTGLTFRARTAPLLLPLFPLATGLLFLVGWHAFAQMSHPASTAQKSGATD